MLFRITLPLQVVIVGLRALDSVLDLVEGTDRATEALVMFFAVGRLVKYGVDDGGAHSASTAI